jgi:dGTPase
VRHTNGELPATLEGCVVRLADRIAYINHDIDDALRAGVLHQEEIPEQQLLGSTHSGRINTLIMDTIRCSEGKGVITMSAEIGEGFETLHSFMYDSVYLNPVAKGEEKKAVYIIQQLYRYFMNHVGELHQDYRHICDAEGPDIAVCDYIAGMTDRFAIQVYTDLYVPQGWNR